MLKDDCRITLCTFQVGRSHSASSKARRHLIPELHLKELYRNPLGEWPEAEKPKECGKATEMKLMESLEGLIMLCLPNILSGHNNRWRL